MQSSAVTQKCCGLAELDYSKMVKVIEDTRCTVEGLLGAFQWLSADICAAVKDAQ